MLLYFMEPRSNNLPVLSLAAMELIYKQNLGSS